MLALFVIWAIVALALWCCYRLWYWSPTGTIPATQVSSELCPEEVRAA